MVAFSKLLNPISEEDIVDKRYENGKIYLIKCKYDDELVYVGSTIQILDERFKRHQKDNTCSLYNYIDGDWDNWYIELYEDYPCKNKYVLERREGEVQRQIATINIRIAGRTAKEYHQDNRDNLLKKCKQFYQDNHDTYLEKAKQYHHNNRDKIIEKWKQKITCERCGSISTKIHIARHKKTKKCLNYNIGNN